MKPYDVKTLSDLLSMESDNHPQDAEVWTILNHDNGVSLHAPSNVARGLAVHIPRDQFNKIVDWYTKDQPAKPSEDRS